MTLTKQQVLDALPDTSGRETEAVWVVGVIRDLVAGYDGDRLFAFLLGVLVLLRDAIDEAEQAVTEAGRKEAKR